MYKGQVRSPALVIILSIVTCGIYAWYWIYKMSEELQRATGKSTISPGVELLLCIVTCGIYLIYWFYKYGKMITEAQEQAGLNAEDNAVLYLLLAIFGLGVVNMALMQSAVNKIWEQDII